MLLHQRKMQARGVYINFKDRTRKRKSESLTAPDLTPKQALREFVRFLRDRKRKAG